MRRRWFGRKGEERSGAHPSIRLLSLDLDTALDETAESSRALAGASCAAIDADGNPANFVTSGFAVTPNVGAPRLLLQCAGAYFEAVKPRQRAFHRNMTEMLIAYAVGSAMKDFGTLVARSFSITGRVPNLEPGAVRL